MQYSIDFGSKKLVYTLLYSKRKTLGITVNPDMGIVVKAPENSAMELIEKEVDKIKTKLKTIVHSYFLIIIPDCG